MAAENIPELPSPCESWRPDLYVGSSTQGVRRIARLEPGGCMLGAGEACDDAQQCASTVCSDDMCAPLE
ncbi:MAG: hypothetical protein H6744_03370 [Deltaproteobacteria bacterium]|nr:hypothetical protein [Deltaproteobacteria bacterium]MCB9785716.1 hypothetical protein [Deltaproteobacteria bacterium]